MLFAEQASGRDQREKRSGEKRGEELIKSQIMGIFLERKKS